MKRKEKAAVDEFVALVGGKTWEPVPFSYTHLDVYKRQGFLVHRKYQRRTVLKLNPVDACRCTSRAV